MTPPAVPIPKFSLDMQLDRLLIEWYELQRSYMMTRGVTKDLRTTGGYSSSNYMDWFNGVADDRADALQIQATDEAIHNIPNDPERWRTVLEFNARNLYYRINVWYSPVLPDTRAKRDQLLVEARKKLAQELIAKGVIG